MMLQFTLAAVVLKVAYLATAVTLCLIGKSLLEKGITGKITGEGEIASKKLRIVTSSPGIVFLLAGLCIVVVAIRTQVEIPVSLGDTVPSSAVPKSEPSALTTSPPAAKANHDLPGKAKQVGYAKFMATDVQEKEERSRAHQYYARASEHLGLGEKLLAEDHLLRAVALDPALVDKALGDASLRSLTDSPLFGTYAAARLELALKIQQRQLLPPNGRTAISFLRMRSKLVGSAGKTVGGSVALPTLPARHGLEPIATTQESLRLLIQKNPEALIEFLQEPAYRWILEHEELSEWLVEASQKASVSFEQAPK